MFKNEKKSLIKDPMRHDIILFVLEHAPNLLMCLAAYLFGSRFSHLMIKMTYVYLLAGIDPDIDIIFDNRLELLIVLIMSGGMLYITDYNLIRFHQSINQVYTT
jgi:hypothetical protein